MDKILYTIALIVCGVYFWHQSEQYEPQFEIYNELKESSLKFVPSTQNILREKLKDLKQDSEFYSSDPRSQKRYYIDYFNRFYGFSNDFLKVDLERTLELAEREKFNEGYYKGIRLGFYFFAGLFCFMLVVSFCVLILREKEAKKLIKTNNQIISDSSQVVEGYLLKLQAFVNQAQKDKLLISELTTDLKDIVHKTAYDSMVELNSIRTDSQALRDDMRKLFEGLINELLHKVQSKIDHTTSNVASEIREIIKEQKEITAILNENISIMIEILQKKRQIHEKRHSQNKSESKKPNERK